jgi:hypothetical protein
MNNGIIGGEGQAEITAAFATLSKYRIPHASAYKEYQDMLESLARTPSEDDMRWPLVEVTDLTDHLTDEQERPVLSAAIVIGRAYSLSPAQRDVVRKWFNMTPAPLVEVLDLKLFEGTKFVQHVVLRSMEHIDPRRKRVMNKFTIDRWGKFMSQVQEREAEIQQQRELDTFTARVQRLFDKAKDEGVLHKQRTPGYLANRLHTEVMIRKLIEPKDVRELFRSILLSVHEHELAKLVREPKYWPDRLEKASGPAKVKAIEQLMSEYGV